MKWVVRYLVGTQNYGLCFPCEDDKTTTAWLDSNWGLDLEKRRSREGHCISVGSASVLWSSNLLKPKALSASKAEFCALSKCIKQLTWVRNIFSEIEKPLSAAVQLFQDKLRNMPWSQDVVGLRRVKHTDLRYHIVLDAVSNDQVAIEYIESASTRQISSPNLFL